MKTATSFKMDNKLLTLDAIYVSSVLEDCVDQLAILGKIMPTSLEGKPDAEQVLYLAFMYCICSIWQRTCNF